MIKWGIVWSAGLTDLRNILVAALVAATQHSSAIEILNYIFPLCNTYDPALLLASAELGKRDVFEWALSANTISWDVEQVFDTALRFGQLSFCDYLLIKYQKNPKIQKFRGLHSVIFSMNPKVLEYAHKKLKIEILKGIAVFVMFLSNYRGRPEDHQFWNYMKSEILKDNHEKVIAQFKKTYGTVWKYMRFSSRARFTLDSVQFFEFLGFPVSEMDLSSFIPYLNKNLVKSLIDRKSNNELVELFKVCASHSRVDLALYILDKSGGFIDPEYLVVAIASNQRPILEYAFLRNPSSYSPSSLFVQAMKKRAEWDHCSWDCFAFLLHQGASLPSNSYQLTIDQKFPLSFCYFLYKFGAKIENTNTFRSGLGQRVNDEERCFAYLNFLEFHDAKQ